jgi:hypothetical protein
LPGAAVSIEFRWKAGGFDQHSRAEDFVENLETKASMTKGDWTYTGSRMIAGSFVAQEDGSIVSVMLDPDALINNPRPGRENDKIWQVNSKKVLPLNWPIEVWISLKRVWAGS